MPAAVIVVHNELNTPASSPHTGLDRGDHRLGTVTLWIIACALLALLLGCVHAQSWTQYQLGGMTFYRSDDGTTGSSYELGGTTYSQFVGPDGKIRRCSSTTFTDCQ